MSGPHFEQDAYESAFDAESYQAQTGRAEAPWDDDAPSSRNLTAAALSHRLDVLDERIEAESDPVKRKELEAEYNQTFDDWELYSGSGDWRAAGGNEGILARNEEIRQADRPDGTEKDPHLIRRGRREELRGGTTRRLTDAAAIRGLIREAAASRGVDADELLQRPPRGRPTPEEAARKQTLAAILFELKTSRGATIEALAAASSRTVSSVHALLSDAERRGAP